MLAGANSVTAQSAAGNSHIYVYIYTSTYIHIHLSLSLYIYIYTHTYRASRWRIARPRAPQIKHVWGRFCHGPRQHLRLPANKPTNRINLTGPSDIIGVRGTAVRLGTTYCTPEIDTSEIVDFQRHCPMDFQ